MKTMVSGLFFSSLTLFDFQRFRMRVCDPILVCTAVQKKEKTNIDLRTEGGRLLNAEGVWFGEGGRTRGRTSEREKVSETRR